MAQLDELCQQLNSESTNVVTATRKLAGLAQLKNDVLDHSVRLSEAQELMNSIWDLQDGLLRSGQTIKAAQKMVVEVMLMEPAVDQAVAALKPMRDFYRISRREAVQAEAGAPQKPTTARSPTKNTQAQGTWAEVLKVAVTMLLPLG